MALLRGTCTALISVAFLYAALPARGDGPDLVQTRSAGIDRVFAAIGQTAPGCAVGVAHASDEAVVKAFGSADLEHGVPIRPDTVFEAGSASKQFTAAAILTLVHEGRLALTDDIRKYLPELPDHGSVITIADLLHHTSGLRDWGSVEALAGWPREDRIYGMLDVLHVLSKQKSLNYIPGAKFSYTNSGFSLLAIIVERVSGKSFQAFTSEKLFQPLGMSHTQWRDNFRAVVPNRAIGYGRDGGSYDQQMPFENTVGHAGLLTTVGDLLIWLRALNDGGINPEIVKWMETPGILSNGKTTGYGGALVREKYHDVQLIYHSGATAGYRSWVGRIPAQNLSIALLCNWTNADYDGFAHSIADIYLPAWTPPAMKRVSGREADMLAGLYINERSGIPMRLAEDGGKLVMTGADGSAPKSGNVPISKDPFGLIWIGQNSFAVLPPEKLPNGMVEPIRLAERATYGAGEDDILFDKSSSVSTESDRAGLDGRYISEEAGATFVVTPTPNCLRMSIEDRPSVSGCLQGVYKGAFMWNRNLVKVVRSQSGTADTLIFSNERIWDLRVRRVN